MSTATRKWKLDSAWQEITEIAEFTLDRGVGGSGINTEPVLTTSSAR
ncbi:MAG TPA: hypothetical protein VMF10_01475 [Candidatus Aquilonibacter sp.]|nr:hypothetical protein [Candidatus Aquilonibacter sp.]